MSSELKDKTTKGIFWGAIDSGVQQILALLFGIILSNILTPGDYGMVGMLTIFTAIGTSLQESGFKSALINIKNIRHEDYNAVFWTSFSLGIIVYCILFILSPYIALYYRTPELTPLARYSFLSIPISSLGTAHAGFLARNMLVKQQAYCGITAHILSGIIGIIMAILGFGYWGIATLSLAYISIVTIGLWYFSSWRPTLHIQLQPIVPIFKFSSKLLVTNIISSLNGNILNLILGRYFTPSILGNYTQANKWSNTGNSFINGMLSKVVQPVFSSISDDLERKRRIFKKVLSFICFLSFPALLGLSLVSHELILITIGEKWHQAIPIMQIICIGCAFVPLSNLFAQLVLSQQKSNEYMWGSLVQIIIMFILSYTIIKMTRQIIHIAFIYMFINIIWVNIWFFIAKKHIGIHYKEFILCILPSLSVSICSYMIVYYTLSYLNLGLISSFLYKICVMALIYGFTMYFVQPIIFREVIDFFKKKIA